MARQQPSQDYQQPNGLPAGSDRNGKVQVRQALLDVGEALFDILRGPDPQLTEAGAVISDVDEEEARELRLHGRDIQKL